MSFEEFFIKKRIDLPALEKAEPSLFSEFRSHFTQMGEKSFDYTKKYLFNKLRRQYHLAPELKPEKVHVANPLAEQTITESLGETIEPAIPASKVGFVPRFKAVNVAKPVNTDEPAENAPTEVPAESVTAAPNVDFVPRFKAANMAKPPAEKTKIQGAKEDVKVTGLNTDAGKQEEDLAPKPAYKPRFNMKNIPPKPGQ